MLKVVFDTCCAIVLLIVFLPLMLVIALLVKVTSPGPAIFTQCRVGRGGKEFTVFKFRTMWTEAEVCKDAVTTRCDPRITPFGKVLRRTHLDELPQLVNVLLGQMSMVGPRPITPQLMALYCAEETRYRERLQVRPGLTGLVQIHGREKELRSGVRRAHLLNRYYIRHQTLFLDVCILARTPIIMLKQMGM